MASIGVFKAMLDIPLLFQIIAGALLLGIIYYKLIDVQRPYPGIPVIELDDQKSKSSRPDPSIFATREAELTAKGLETTNGPFQVFTSAGYKIILPNRFAHELRNNPDMSFTRVGDVDFHAQLPGMEPFRELFKSSNGILRDVVQAKLTQSLGLVTEDLVEEADCAIRPWLGDAKDWSDVEVRTFIYNVVGRVSSRIFGGKELARDEEWLGISTRYTISVNQAVNRLRGFPAILRPIAHRLLPESRQAKAELRAAQRLAEPQVEKRLKIREAAIAAGAPPKSLPDVFSWTMEMAKGRQMFLVETQLALSMAAIHTTTEMVMRCLVASCEHPEIQRPLREEMIKVLGSDGWSMSAFYKMKLLDSFMKECQRYFPLSSMAMGRVAEKAVVLSDGTVLPKNSYSIFLDSGTRDNNIYAHPSTFDAWRYLKMRERPGEENQHQFVSTSVDHLGFGHGVHACPGRFFASNEMKIIVCFLLIEYEWQFGPDQERLPDLKFEGSMIANPATKMQVRKREAEIDVLRPMA
ncbi:unnamed protein product [Zymoseptoria tritici ST99CH_1A5]|uniref:Cytochrome P450 monooxygenase n=1 Tax=Zymoseptoria tritici ST99CH_1A5 TaxID=1276529 RepID=A0A1Y6LUD6_ZYMTR|nr:unnamed protein product [Zymoseptoria tritici ST99CH_1A5]